MVYSEDVKKFFRRECEYVGSSEISISGFSRLVIAGHRGVILLSGDEVVVRLRGGRIRVTGRDLRLDKASPSEIFLEGRIFSVEFPSDSAGEGR